MDADTLFEDVAFARGRGNRGGVRAPLLDPRGSTTARHDRTGQGPRSGRRSHVPVVLLVYRTLAGNPAVLGQRPQPRVAPNLRLRDLDGTTIAYCGGPDTDEELSRFAETVFPRHANRLVSRRRLVLKSLRMAWQTRRRYLLDYGILLNANLRVMHKMALSPTRRIRRNYLGGTDILRTRRTPGSLRTSPPTIAATTSTPS